MKMQSSYPRPVHASAFSLLEVLIATLILGIGLIMVASIFPVGANWSRQGAEETIAQNLALNAVSIVKAKYVTAPSAGGFKPTVTPTDATEAYYAGGSWKLGGGGSLPASPGQRVYCLPHFSTVVPVGERAYNAGAGQPFPVPLSRCSASQYFWTALMKVPDDGSTTVTLYVLVFRRGDVKQVFSQPLDASSTPAAVSPTELTGCRDGGNSNEQLSSKPFTPAVCVGTYLAGKLNSGRIKDAWPAVGSQGIGANSGTIFRQSLAPDGSVAAPSPLLVSQVAPTDAVSEKVITAIPPDGWPDSPLVYIYQTQLSF